MDYKKLYLLLFSSVTAALDEIERKNFGSAAELLRRAQSDCEEMYAEAKD